MSVTVLPPPTLPDTDEGVDAALLAMQREAGNVDTMLLVSLYKDGTSRIIASNRNRYKTQYLAAFVQKWALDLFHLVDTPPNA